MSNESYLCNSLYLNKGYQSINTANDCAIIKSDQINSDKHLLHLTDPENKKDFYVCRGIYNYKEGTCTVNPELTKLISENSPIQQSVVQPVATPVATPAAPEANIPNFTYELLGNDTHCENDDFLIDSASNIELKDLQDKCSKNPECNAISYVPENPNYSSKYGNLYSDCGNPKAHGGRVTYKKVDPSKVVQPDPVAPPPPPPPQMVSIKGNAELMKVYGSENADGTGKGGFEPSVYYDSKKLTWRQQNECKQACLDDPECEIAHHFFSNATCYLGKKEAVADQSKWKCHWDQNGCNGKNYGFYIKQ